MKVNTGSNKIRLEDEHLFMDVNELKHRTGFQTTYYCFGTYKDYCKQKVIILSKDRQITMITTWEDDWKEVVEKHWHDAEILYLWEEGKDKMEDNFEKNVKEFVKNVSTVLDTNDTAEFIIEYKDKLLELLK